MPRAKKLLTVTVDPALFRRIDAAAVKIGQTRSAFVESLLRGALAEADGVSGVLANPKLLQVFYGALAQPGVLDAITASFGQKLSRDEMQQMLSFMSSGAPKSPKRRSRSA